MDTNGKTNKKQAYKVFADNLNRYMADFNIDRITLSKKIGIKYTTFCEWCNGNSMPKIDKINLLAQYFDATVSDFIQEKTPEQNNSKRLIPVYKSLPGNMSFDLKTDKKYLTESMELPNEYGSPEDYFAYEAHTKTQNYMGKVVNGQDTIVFKKTDHISKLHTFYIIQDVFNKTHLFYVVDIGDYTSFIITSEEDFSMYGSSVTTANNELENWTVIGIAVYGKTNY